MVYWKLEIAYLNLDAAGKVKVEAWSEPREKPDSKPGMDFVVREDPQKDEGWLPLPENAFTADYRHTWVFVRNRRPMQPSFVHCPMPRRGQDFAERHAALIMTYFHPFTLDPTRETEHVPYLGNLTRGHQTWEDAMTSWFDGRVLCEEARRYISNFLVVSRARPETGIEEEVRSDDQASDEELYLERASFEDAIIDVADSRPAVDWSAVVGPQQQSPPVPARPHPSPAVRPTSGAIPVRTSYGTRPLPPGACARGALRRRRNAVSIASGIISGGLL